MPKAAKKSPAIPIYFALMLSTLFVFWQVRNFDFISYDDFAYVSENPHVFGGPSADNIIWAFKTGYASNWHPLTWLSLMSDCWLFGPNPGLIHLVNLLLHIANTLLLFAVLKRMTNALWPSAFVAAAFALHPMHVQSVAWIAERKDVLSTFFWMLTLLAYVGYVKRPGLLRYLLTLLAFALGLMAKPMLVTLPFVLLLFDYWPLGRFESQTSRWRILYRIVIEKIPFFALAIISSIITFLVQRSGGAVAEFDRLLLRVRLVNMFLSYVRYIGKMFWPDNLAIFYPFDAYGLAFWQILLSILLLIFISAIVLYLGRDRKYLPVGWFWFIGTLVPLIGLIQVGEQAYADRYTYIPYIGLFIMIAWGLPDILSRLPHRKIILGAAASAVLASLGICSYRQTSYWADSKALFSHALEVTQNNYVAHRCLAENLIKEGNTFLAIEHCRKAIEIRPNSPISILDLGHALDEQGDVDGAIECFQKAIDLKPNLAGAYTSLGVALQKQGKFDQAIACLKRSLEIKPANNAAAENNLAWFLATCPDPNIRNPSDAIRIAEEACRHTGYRDPAVLDTLGGAYASGGRFTDAVDSAKTALSLVKDGTQRQLKNEIERHLAFYMQNKPYIEHVSKKK